MQGIQRFAWIFLSLMEVCQVLTSACALHCQSQQERECWVFGSDEEHRASSRAVCARPILHFILSVLYRFLIFIINIKFDIFSFFLIKKYGIFLWTAAPQTRSITLFVVMPL